jgi:mannitol/fructose-specific phosphotransferase system IIA component (Ntr-type)
MRIADILSRDRVVAELGAKTRDEALERMVEVFVEHGPTGPDGERVLGLLLQRERAGSTGIGNGIAIPHCKVPGIAEPVACFARSTDGVDFSSLDGRPAHLILALFAPEGRASLHLKALARASRLLQDAAFRQRLLDEDDADGLWAAILERDGALGS